MSNRRRLRNPQHNPRSAFTQKAASLDGAHIPGGFDICDALHTVHVVGHSIATLRVHHDDWCATYRRMTEQTR